MSDTLKDTFYICAVHNHKTEYSFIPFYIINRLYGRHWKSNMVL